MAEESWRKAGFCPIFCYLCLSFLLLVANCFLF